ncbi:MAG: formimidoylglutamate deiminase [Alteromonadaceae bacterium]|jgi:formimidoylglutamate deiminase
MKYFQAKWLFDGNQWHRDVSFSVDDKGLFSRCTLTDDGAEVKSLGVVIPGFINCHSHSFQRAMAGLGERISLGQGEDSFWSWREQMYKLVQALTPDTFKQIADWLYVEMLEAGYTSVGEFHYLHNKPNGEAYADSTELATRLYASGVETGIRVCMLPVLYKNGGMGKPLETRQLPFGMADLAQYERYHQQLQQKVPQGHGLGVTAHSIRGVDKDSLKAFAALYNERGIPIHIHIAEQPAEVEDSLAFYGKRPVEFLLDDIGINQNWTLVHATHVTELERQGMAKVNAVVGICPLTEANLGDGIFPMKEFMAEKGAISIGSDSHIRIDPFEELRLIEYSQRYKLGARACLTHKDGVSPGHNLAAACYAGGLQSLKLNTGYLMDGFLADFVELNEDHPALLRQDPATMWDEMIFAGGRELVKNVYTSGKQVVFDSKHSLHDDKLEGLRELYHALG